MQRLDKILSEAGVASRKELKSLIRAGRVTVDGAVVREEAKKFDEAACTIAVDGAAVEKYRKVLLMLHKPAGYVTSTDDPRDRTVMELIPERYRKFGVTPVGRLDKETEGLLLLTNDGDLAHRILSPRSGVWKTYYAEHEGTASAEDCAAFEAGLTLGDGTKVPPGTAGAAGPWKEPHPCAGGQIPSGAADDGRARDAGDVSEAHRRGRTDAGRAGKGCGRGTGCRVGRERNAQHLVKTAGRSCDFDERKLSHPAFQHLGQLTKN